MAICAGDIVPSNSTRILCCYHAVGAKMFHYESVSVQDVQVCGGHSRVSSCATSFQAFGFCRGEGMLAIANYGSVYGDWISFSAQIVLLHFTRVRLFVKGCLHSHFPPGAAVV